MIRQSNYSKHELLQAIGRQVQLFQDATDEVDEAASRRMRLNRTDLRCLGVLARAGAVTASQLADATGLTRGAMTTALDRLETAGYARRVWDQDDRRAVRVEITEEATRQVAALYGPLAKAGVDLLQHYTTKDLAAVLRYLEDGIQLQREHAQLIRDLPDASTKASPTRGRRRARD